jgi:hypothetical protein
MIWHIIARENTDDSFTYENSQTEKRIYIDLSGVDKSIGIRNNLLSVFDSYGFYPSENATDLLKLAMGVYSADKNADRMKAFNKWSRYFHLYQPVNNLDLWNGVKEKIEMTLDFLTGDHWEIHFRKSEERQLLDTKQVQTKFPNLSSSQKAIALISGGLDSFAGAIELLETIPENVIFVSHYGRGGVTKTAQDRIYSLLSRHYSDRFCSLQFFIQPAEGVMGESESSQRSRSFLFLSLGVAVSSASINKVPLNIFENGLLSLNVPLAANRGGGLSTRTTHPYFLLMYQSILDSLGITSSIMTPFRFLTKGEMLISTKNAGVLNEGIKLTHSCSHNTYVRFKSRSFDDHCGYCLPCIIRRAATSHASLEDVNYVVDVVNNNLPPNRAEGKDLYALKIALKRLENMNSSLFSHIRTAGPLQGTREEIVQYVDVYRRGMAEIKMLLG